MHPIKPLLLLLAAVFACGDASAPDSREPADAAPDCQPTCGLRTCGPDPVCGASCGSCEGTCTTDGQCELSDPGGPRIISLTTNSEVLLAGETLEISAIVTDPDGIDDLIGGEARTPGGFTYGVFSTAAQEGAYSLAIGWQRLNDAETIEGDAGISRTIEVYFFDQGGLETRRTLAIELACPEVGQSFCDGGCTDLATSAIHCGACDTPVGDEQLCEAGVPVCQQPDHQVSCGDHCVENSEYNCGTCGNDCYQVADQHGGEYPPTCSRSIPPQDSVCRILVQQETRTVTCSQTCAPLECAGPTYARYESPDWATSVSDIGCDEIAPANHPDYPASAMLSFAYTACRCQQ